MKKERRWQLGLLFSHRTVSCPDQASGTQDEWVTRAQGLFQETNPVRQTVSLVSQATKETSAAQLHLELQKSLSKCHLRSEREISRSAACATGEGELFWLSSHKPP